MNDRTVNERGLVWLALLRVLWLAFTLGTLLSVGHLPVLRSLLDAGLELATFLAGQDGGCAVAFAVVATVLLWPCWGRRFILPSLQEHALDEARR